MKNVIRRKKNQIITKRKLSSIICLTSAIFSLLISPFPLFLRYKKPFIVTMTNPVTYTQHSSRVFICCRLVSCYLYFIHHEIRFMVRITYEPYRARDHDRKNLWYNPMLKTYVIKTKFLESPYEFFLFVNI